MADGIWTFELCDQTDNLLADVTHLVTATVSPRLNRPLALVLQAPADQDEWKTIHTDGDRYLTEGIRTIKAKRNGVLIANPEIWRLDYTGDGNSQQAAITLYDSMQRLSRRSVRDATGQAADWIFDDPITAGDLVQQLFQNAYTYEDGDVPYGSVRLFPIDFTSGSFTASTDVADQIADGPTTMGDLIYRLICDVGVADVNLAPTDTAAGSTAGIYGIVSCVDFHGSDLTGSVHFDYDTGSRNVKAIRRSFDMATVTNWLRYLLGPKLYADHWRGSLGALSGTWGSDTTYRDAEAASRLKYGSLPEYEVFDTNANDVRALYQALWAVEDTLRVNPRQLLYLTPAGNSAFEPFGDYNIGDLVAANLSDNIGPAASSVTQRLYGFDVTVDVNGVETVGELIVSPDGTSF